MKVAVLVAAGGAAWEPSALVAIESAAPRLVLLKRCMDLSDLLTAASTGSASVAVVGASVAGLDLEVVSTLRSQGVAVVAVRDGGPLGDELLARIGVDHQLDAAQLDGLPSVLAGTAPPPADALTPSATAQQPGPGQAQPGRVLAVWGPAGGPGRTTVGTGLAVELAALGHDTLLIDADPYGGAVAQHLGILDQVSGLLAAARLANTGRLDAAALARAARSVGERLRVLTGLPRADRWVEVRAPAYDELLGVAAEVSTHVVVDVGFCLERDPDPHAPPTGRNTLTLASLERADCTVVVGSADPVGLTRLVRGLHDLGEVAPTTDAVVVVNRMRASLGWGEREVADLVRGVLPEAPVHFLPFDRVGADRALMAGRSLAESGDSSLRRAVAALGQALSSRYSPVTV